MFDAPESFGLIIVMVMMFLFVTFTGVLLFAGVWLFNIIRLGIQVKYGM